ncbi:MAG: hypothetical protein IPI65_08325 [Bacteroidetes bacterium]|nr:hypothetical protein [Bacteroidota bacterium]
MRNALFISLSWQSDFTNAISAHANLLDIDEQMATGVSVTSTWFTA